MRDFFNADPRELLELCLEDIYLNELHRTGRIDDLDLYAIDVIEGAKAYPGDRAVAENAYVADRVQAEVEKMNWGTE